MKRTEKVMEMINDLEDNGNVVISVVVDNFIVSIEEVKDYENVTHIGVVGLDEYEENGFDYEGLSTNWIVVE